MSNKSQNIVPVDRIRGAQSALATIDSPVTVQGVVAEMKRTEQIAKALGLGEAVLLAGETRLLAQRRLGELLADIVKPGRPTSETVPSVQPLDRSGTVASVEALEDATAGMDARDAERILLRELGLNNNASSRLQRLAGYTDEQIRTFCREQVDLGAGVPGIQAVLDVLSGRHKLGPDHAPSKSVEHYTPPEVVALVVECFGEISLDPCCNPGKANIPAKKVYRERDDGLSKPWHGSVYVNPPYGRDVAEWVLKALTELQEGRAKEVIMLLASRTDTDAFKALRGSTICFFDERIAFIGERNTGKAPFPSAAFYLGPKPDRFAKAFRPAGPVYVLHPMCKDLPA